MKHKFSITLILLVMFLITQIIGLIVINAYSPGNQTIPFGLDTSENIESANIFSFIFSFIFIFMIFSILMKHDFRIILKIWFLVVVLLALAITFTAFIDVSVKYSALIALGISVPLVFFKVVKPNIYVHNFTELFVYPGVAVLMISLIYNPIKPLFGVWVILALLILISIYDLWAVWKSGIMQKMAKYQIEKLNIFGGFLLPTIDKSTRKKIKQLKQKYKDKKELSKKIEKKKFKINLAILGGGDVVFPIITAGVFMWSFPSQRLFGVSGLIPALFVLAGAFIGLAFLFMITKKKKSYPAMPYISLGIFISLLIWRLFFF